MRRRVFLALILCFSLVSLVSARVQCVINTSSPSSQYQIVDNVTTQGHYSGGSIYELYCSKNWPLAGGNVSFRYVDAGHVQDADINTFPEEEYFGEGINCTYRPEGDPKVSSPGTCSDPAETCAFTMNNEDNAHIADCDQDSLPGATNYTGTLCCEVKEICTDGIDNDGDGLIDCADPECTGAIGNSTLEPTPNKQRPEVCHPPSCPQTLHEDLQGFWQFENTTADASGNGNNGTNYGANYTAYRDGRLGAALRFDDTNDYVEVPDDTSYYQTLDPKQAVTLAAYISPDNTGETRGIIGKGLNSPYQLYHNNAGDLRFTFTSSNGTTYRYLGDLSTGSWQHVAATYNASTGRIKGYIDGVEVADVTVDKGNLTDNNDSLFIGDLPDQSDGFFAGKIDQPRIYNRVLNATEIQSFTDTDCLNRQRTIECLNNPDLCDTNYTSADTDSYHCNYGKYDDPTNTDYEDAPRNGTGVCCPKDERAAYDPFNDKWTCRSTDQCGISPGSDCEYDITANESAWFASKSDGSVNACNSQVNDLREDLNETTQPEGSQACCYVPKKGVLGYWYKDGNVKIYG